MASRAIHSGIRILATAMGAAGAGLSKRYGFGAIARGSQADPILRKDDPVNAFDGLLSRGILGIVKDYIKGSMQQA